MIPFYTVHLQNLSPAPLHTSGHGALEKLDYSKCFSVRYLSGEPSFFNVFSLFWLHINTVSLKPFVECLYPLEIWTKKEERRGFLPAVLWSSLVCLEGGGVNLT